MSRSTIVRQPSFGVSVATQNHNPAFIPATLSLLEGLLNAAWDDFLAHCRAAIQATRDFLYEIELQCVLFARRFIRARE